MDGDVNEPPDTWLRVTLEEADTRADGYFLSCTNIHSLNVIGELEARLGKGERVAGLGRLFEAAAGDAVG